MSQEMLKNGLETQINYVPTKIFYKGISIFAKTIQNSKLDISNIIKEHESLQDLLSKGNLDLNSIVDIILSLLGETELYDIIFEWLSFSTCDGQRINHQLLDVRPEDIRPVLIELITLCLKKNLSVFFSNLNFMSNLSGMTKSIKTSQK